MVHFTDEQGIERVSVPLVMLPGNMDVLLNHMIPVKGISLRKYASDYFPDLAVVLVTHGTDKEIAEALGFKSTPAPVKA
jgi:hypothetical protein